MQDLDHITRTAAISLSARWEGGCNYSFVSGHDAHELQPVHAGCVERRSWALDAATLNGYRISLNCNDVACGVKQALQLM